MAPIRNGEGEKLKLGVIEGYRGSEKSRFERGDIENGGVDEDSSVWIIDRVEGNIRERDRNGKQDELIGGWKNRPCFRTMQVIGEENREDNRVKGILERRVVWMEDIREKFGLTREVNHCKTN